MASESTQSKARRLVKYHPELVRQDEQFPHVWWVGSLRDAMEKPYRVEFGGDENGEWTMCTCTHGMNNMGNAHCYHVEAAREVYASQEER